MWLYNRGGIIIYYTKALLENFVYTKSTTVYVKRDTKEQIKKSLLLTALIYFKK